MEYTHVTLVKEDDKPEDGEELVQRDASLHQGGQGQDYKDKYTHVTLVEEDVKQEDGEEVELRRRESSQKRARTRTTRKSIIGTEIKEGRVVEQTGGEEKARGGGRRQEKRSRVCWEVGAWEKSKARG